VLILSLIIQPAAIGRSYRPAKFECPDTVALTNRFSWSFRFVRRRSIEANSPGAPTTGAGAAFERHLNASRRSRIEAGVERRNDQSRDDLSWIEIRLQCAASVAARSKAGRGLRRCAGSGTMSRG
jgi:hypothetical protein